MLKIFPHTPLSLTFSKHSLLCSGTLCLPFPGTSLFLTFPRSSQSRIQTSFDCFLLNIGSRCAGFRCFYQSQNQSFKRLRCLDGDCFGNKIEIVNKCFRVPADGYHSVLYPTELLIVCGGRDFIK